jgi:hypothetical protein
MLNQNMRCTMVLDNVSPVLTTDHCLTLNDLWMTDTNLWWSSQNAEVKHFPSIYRNYKPNDREIVSKMKSNAIEFNWASRTEFGSPTKKLK